MTSVTKDELDSFWDSCHFLTCGKTPSPTTPGLSAKHDFFFNNSLATRTMSGKIYACINTKKGKSRPAYRRIWGIVSETTGREDGRGFILKPL
jgi:hypothetical protein